MINMQEYRVFFSKDNMMYGVEKLVIDNGSGRKMFWQQVLPPKNKGGRSGKSAYTYYEKVAHRWLKELQLNELVKEENNG